MGGQRPFDAGSDSDRYEGKKYENARGQMCRLLFDKILGQVPNRFRERGVRPPGTARRRRVGVVEKAVALVNTRECVGKGNKQRCLKRLSPKVPDVP